MDQWTSLKQSMQHLHLNLKDSLSNIIGVYGTRTAGIQSLIVQCLTVAVYIYLTLLYVHSSLFFYPFLALSTIQTIITIYFSIFLFGYLHYLKSGILYREDSPYLLSFGIIKIIFGSPFSGIIDVMLWTEVSSLWYRKDGITRNSDIIISLRQSSSIILLCVLFFFALEFFGLIMPYYYAYLLLALGLALESLVISMKSHDSVSVSYDSFMLFMLEDFYIFAILLNHFIGDSLIAAMRIELFLIVLAFSIFDFLYFQSYFNSTTNGKEVYNFRAFLGAIVILFSAIYIVLPTIAIAFVSFLISGKPEFPQVTWSLSSTTTFLSLLIADALGYLVIGYLLSYILIDQFKGVDNLSYEFNLSTFVEKKVDETFEAISENLDRELEKSKEMEERIKELEERIKELEKERQQLIASIRTEYERGFFDASKKMNDEFNRNKKIIEKNAKDEILNLLFEFDYAPRDGQSKKTFFTRIRNGLTKIYHPDHNIGADTNRIMQIINEHYEKLTK